MTTIPVSFPRCIGQLAERFNDPSVMSSLKGLTKTLQVSLSDLTQEYIFTIKDGILYGVEKKALPTADMSVTIASTLMEGIMNGTSNGILAFLTGKVKMKGARDDLLRLQRVLG
jgi:putative sterol carrier protein